jgi:hypothetical protein
MARLHRRLGPAARSFGLGRRPSLPSLIEQAIDEMRHDARRMALSILETDPGDDPAAALARYGRRIENEAKPQ